MTGDDSESLKGRIVNRLTQLTDSLGLKPLDQDFVRVVLESNVHLDQGSLKVYLKSSAIILSDPKSDDLIMNLGEAGPSWIHLTCIVNDSQVVLITLKKGQDYGNPQPSLPYSVESRYRFSLDDQIYYAK